jgi:uncharacterized lipoprotein YddW (UPF0748 family)
MSEQGKRIWFFNSIAFPLILSKMKLFLLFLYIVIASHQLFSDEPAIHEFRGVWFSQNTAIEFSPDSLDRLFKQFADAGFNAVFPRVWYRGGTIYPSDVVEAAGGPRQLSVFRSGDPLPILIETAHRYGLEVHAWMEYGFMMSPGGVGAILTANPEWKILSKDSLSYEDTIYGRFYWADPANPEVRQFLVDLHREVAEKYPDIDGIHTDRLRFPNDEFSYTTAARERFQDETGGPDPVTISRGTADWNTWVRWRREQTALAQKDIYEAVKSVREDITVSAAVVPPYMIGPGQEKLQYWPDWTANGYVDILIPMLYLPDGSFPDQFASARSLAGDFEAVYPGIAYQHGMAAGGNIAGANQSLAYQIRHTRAVPIEGYVLWYQGYLVDYNVLSFLQDEVQNDIAAIPQRERVISPKTQHLLHRTGTWNEQPGGPWESYYIAESEASTSLTWEFSFPYYGIYEIHVWVDGAESYAAVAKYNIYINNVETDTYSISHDQLVSGWRYIGDIILSAHDKAIIELDAGSSSGTVFASAARIRVKEAPCIETIDVIDSRTLKLKFNFPLSGQDVPLPGQIYIDPTVPISDISYEDESTGSIVISTTADISYYIIYTITVETITDAAGRTITDLRKSFSYYPDGSTEWVLVLNDGDMDIFRIDGNLQYWSNKISQVPGYIGNGYRQTFTKTGPVGLQRAFWKSDLPADGLYKVSANWTSDTDRSNGVPYIIHRNEQPVDTVRVDQRYNGSSWQELGVYAFEEGDSIFIELNNEVYPPPPSPLRIIADAVRIRRMHTTGLNESGDGREQLSSQIMLYQNYPNPYNPVTTISFSLIEHGQTELRVYDMLGRYVVTLLHEHLEAGTHRVVFDARRLSSGLYFYRLISNDRMLTRRMTLIK